MKVSDDLRNFEYISLSMLLTLAEANVRSLDDLADLDNDELVEILAEHELTDDSEAGDIIMAARAHWFADEDDAESDAVASDDASADSAAEDGGDAADS
jgi:N utilization substance protein A